METFEVRVLALLAWLSVELAIIIIFLYRLTKPEGEE